ncbi:conserved hypothetical protein [Streptomyces lividans TK24]|nr:conserved hypothetical protein [Streptomyces lividans TK24]
MTRSAEPVEQGVESLGQRLRTAPLRQPGGGGTQMRQLLGRDAVQSDAEGGVRLVRGVVHGSQFDDQIAEEPGGEGAVQGESVMFVQVREEGEDPLVAAQHRLGPTGERCRQEASGEQAPG